MVRGLYRYLNIRIHIGAGGLGGSGGCRIKDMNFPPEREQISGSWWFGHAWRSAAQSCVLSTGRNPLTQTQMCPPFTCLSREINWNGNYNFSITWFHSHFKITSKSIHLAILSVTRLGGHRACARSKEWSYIICLNYVMLGGGGGVVGTTRSPRPAARHLSSKTLVHVYVQPCLCDWEYRRPPSHFSRKRGALCPGGGVRSDKFSPSLSWSYNICDMTSDTLSNEKSYDLRHTEQWEKLWPQTYIMDNIHDPHRRLMPSVVWRYRLYRTGLCY